MENGAQHVSMLTFRRLSRELSLQRRCSNNPKPGGVQANTYGGIAREEIKASSGTMKPCGEPLSCSASSSKAVGGGGATLAGERNASVARLLWTLNRGCCLTLLAPSY